MSRREYGWTVEICFWAGVRALYRRTRWAGGAKEEYSRFRNFSKIASFLNSVRSVSTFASLRPVRRTRLVSCCCEKSYPLPLPTTGLSSTSRSRTIFPPCTHCAPRNLFWAHVRTHHCCRAATHSDFINGRQPATESQPVGGRTNVRHTHNNGYPGATGVYGTREHYFRTRSGDLRGTALCG